MAKNLFVAGLDYNVTDGQLEEVFSQSGTVVSAKVIMDRETDRSKGFGFVEMGTNEEAEAAIQALNGTDLMGRTLMVKEARPKGESTGRSFGGNSRPGGSGGGGSRFGNNNRSGGSSGGGNRDNRNNNNRGGRSNNGRDDYQSW